MVRNYSLNLCLFSHNIFLENVFFLDGRSCFLTSLAAFNQHYVVSGNHIGHDTQANFLLFYEHFSTS